MALNQISQGAAPNDGNGTELRTGGEYINAIITQMWDTVTGGIAYLLGKVGIGTATPSHRLTVESSGDNIVRFVAKGTGFGGSSICEVYSERTSTTPNPVLNAGSAFSPNAFKIETSGEIVSLPTYNNVTGSAANVYIDTNGRFYYSSSSERTKTNLEPISPEYSANIFRIAKEAVIFYKSLGRGDNPEWTWYGISAEKLAEIEPRLVHWGYWPDDYNKVDYIEKGIKRTKDVLKGDAKMTPVGVQYDRIISLVLPEMDRMNNKINDLEKRLSKLENK